MKLLSVTENTTLSDLSRQLGSSLDTFLHLNDVERTPRVGKSFFDKCRELIYNTANVSSEKRATLLNGLTTDSDIFERASLLDSNGWKLLSSANTLPGMMKIPDGVSIPDSTNVMGNGESIQSSIYNKVMGYIKRGEDVDPSVFNTYNTSLTIRNVESVSTANWFSSTSSGDVFQWFGIPWGLVTLYSSLDDSRVDFPVYPEELSDGRKANYTTMPDMLYQYEPWQLYQSSGPRTQTYTFHFHRDMWTGDHRDGKANELIRACEANCYPEYKGSAVYTSTVTFYVGGSPLITGVLTDVNVDWSGPIGLDDWYLECKLSISITEVSDEPLNFYSVKSKPLIG